MIKIKAKLELNQEAIKKIQDAAIKALPLTMESMKTEINNMQVVPKETGNLEESVKTGVEKGKGYISYNTPYARRLYYHPDTILELIKTQMPKVDGWIALFMALRKCG